LVTTPLLFRKEATKSRDSLADLIENPKSDARTHRTPKALRAKSIRSGVLSQSAQADLWVERVVLNALATHAAWSPYICAFDDSSAIVLPQRADPPQ
jgi:hypothetical protein